MHNFNLTNALSIANGTFPTWATRPGLTDAERQTVGLAAFGIFIVTVVAIVIGCTCRHVWRRAAYTPTDAAMAAFNGVPYPPSPYATYAASRPIAYAHDRARVKPIDKPETPVSEARPAVKTAFEEPDPKIITADIKIEELV